MTDVLAKLVTHYQGNATLYPTVPLWFGMAPELTAFPYAVYSATPTNGPTHFFPKSDDLVVEEIVVEFRMYHTALATLAAYQDSLHSRFDKCSLTLTASGDKFLSCLREGHSLDDTGQVASNNLHVYLAKSRYRIAWQNAL